MSMGLKGCPGDTGRVFNCKARGRLCRPDPPPPCEQASGAAALSAQPVPPPFPGGWQALENRSRRAADSPVLLTAGDPLEAVGRHPVCGLARQRGRVALYQSARSGLTRDRAAGWAFDPGTTACAAFTSTTAWVFSTPSWLV